MTAKYVKYDQAGEVVTVTVDRPDLLNAISRRVYSNAAFELAETDDGVKVIIVAGAGSSFGAGHDLGTAEMLEELPEFPRDTSPLGRVKDMDRGFSGGCTIVGATSAMIQGYCIMGSWMLPRAAILRSLRKIRNSPIDQAAGAWRTMSTRRISLLWASSEPRSIFGLAISSMPERPRAWAWSITSCLAKNWNQRPLARRADCAQ